MLISSSDVTNMNEPHCLTWRHGSDSLDTTQHDACNISIANVL